MVISWVAIDVRTYTFEPNLGDLKHALAGEMTKILYVRRFGKFLGWVFMSRSTLFMALAYFKPLPVVSFWAPECFYDSPPPHASDGLKTDSAPFLPHYIFFLLVRPVHVDDIVNASLSRIFLFNLATCSGEYSLFSGSCNRQFGGGLS